MPKKTEKEMGSLEMRKKKAGIWNRERRSRETGWGRGSVKNGGMVEEKQREGRYERKSQRMKT